MRVGNRWMLVALGSVAIACGRPADDARAPSLTPASKPAPAWLGLVVDHWLPGPYARGRAPEDRSAVEAECRSCHAEIAREWAGSQHASSWSSPAFQAAFAREPLPFCQRCHAPEVPGRATVPDWAAQIGVGCVSCHVEPDTGQIWSASAGGPTHPVVRKPAFAGPQACAGCHEFEFPDARVRDRPLLMQSTIREHAASAAADQSCADCHMPARGHGEARHRSHEFLGAYSREMLARSLIITATRERVDGHERAVLRLDPGEVGHAVPTGDLLRRLELRLDAIGPDGQPRELGRRWLRRRFGPIQQRNGITVRGEIEDTRVGPGGVVVELSIPADAEAGPVRWTITHQRVAEASSDPRRAAVEGAIEFASGLLEGRDR